jgi:hypothetical protein
MNLRRILAAAALAAALFVPVRSDAEDDPQLAVGTVERVDREGRIYVGGQPYAVTGDTEVFDQIYRKAAAAEIVAGVAVEITYENTIKGATAKMIVATLMR